MLDISHLLFSVAFGVQFMIYSHFVFVCLRVASVFVVSSFPAHQRAGFRSLVYSFDTIITVIIYFLPKVRRFRQRGVDSAVGSCLTKVCTLRQFIAISSPDRRPTNRNMIYIASEVLRHVVARISGASEVHLSRPSEVPEPPSEKVTVSSQPDTPINEFKTTPGLVPSKGVEEEPPNDGDDAQTGNFSMTDFDPRAPSSVLSGSPSPGQNTSLEGV